MNRTMDALHPDESVLVQAATELKDHGIFHISTLRYPPLHAQLTVLTVSFMRGALRESQLFLAARGVSIAASLGSLILIYLIGLHWNSFSALTACAFLSIAMVAARESHWANPESLSAFWVLAALLIFVRLEKSGSLHLYILLGMVLALGIASKYFAFLFVHLPLLSVFADSSSRNPASRQIAPKSQFRTTMRKVMSSYAIFAVALFLLLGIYVVRDPDMLLQAYREHSPWAGQNGLYGIFPGPVAVPTYTASVFPVALGWPLYLFSMAGIALSAIRRKRREIMLIAAILPFFIFLEMIKYHPLRFSLSLAPVLCLFAAVFFDWVMEHKSRMLVGSSIVALAVVLIFSGIYSYAFIEVLNPKKDARLLATNWLESTGCDRRRIAVLGVDLEANAFGFIQYDGMDRLSGHAYDLTAIAPQYIVVPRHVAFIFDQHRKLASEGYRYSSRDWAPMAAPSVATLDFYDDRLTGRGYRQIMEFANVPRWGSLTFDPESLRFDLALTNLELDIYAR